MRHIASVFALILLVLPSAPAKATSVLWTLHDVAFSTGQTAEGSFWYDADTNIYTLNGPIEITPPTADGIDNDSFISVWTVTPETSFDSQLAVWTDKVSLQWNWVLALDWDGVLTNAGGVVPVNNAQTYRCFADDCSTIGASYSPYTLTNPNQVGYVSASVVPLPAAAWLFGSALLGLGVIKRKRA